MRNLNLKLGIKLFKLDNLFSYILFNKIIEIFLNKKKLNCTSKNFFKTGVTKLENINIKKISDIQNELKKQIFENFEEPIFRYKIKGILKEIIIDLLKNDLNEPINILKSLFGYNVFVTAVQVRRTQNFNKNEKFNESIYSENYHCDKYLGTHFKQFIYLNDVDKDRGPFIFLNKKNSKKFIKNENFSNRFSNDISNEKYSKYEDYFIGQAGSSMLANTTECLHRAGIPRKSKFRDILVITYVASPLIDDHDHLYFVNKFEEKFWDNEKEGLFSKKLAKPHGIKKFFKFIFFHIKNLNAHTNYIN